MMKTATFRRGDYVIYKNNGVCLIEDICPLSFGTNPAKEYYILRPCSSDGTIYVPKEGIPAEKLKKIPCREKIDEIIDRAEQWNPDWIENSKLRIVAFDKILSEGDRAKILWVAKMLTIKKREDKNKKLCANEERILSTAEKMITEEFSFALKLEKREVIPYILKRNRKK